MKLEKNSNRVVLISGGSRGLGLATVRALLEADYQVVTFSRKESPELTELINELPGRLVFFKADLADQKSLRKVVRQTEKEVGPIQALVNNAAISINSLMVQQSDEDIDSLIDINLRGTIALTRSVVRGMLIRRYGRIVNVSSIVSMRGYKGVAVYSATKAAIDGMTRSLARELGRRNITVNSVAPGYMETELVSHLEKGQLDSVSRRTPLGRLGKPEDIVGAIRFLLSNEASFLTGQTLVIDGGLTS